MAVSGNIPNNGIALDIGCGGGEFLKCFDEKFPHWKLYGMDIGKQFRDKVMAIENVVDFFSSINQISPQLQFDLITINSVLSLSDNVTELLQFAYEHLKADGMLYVTDTDSNNQPWNLYEIDTQIPLNINTMKNLLLYFRFDMVENIFSATDKQFGLICRKNYDNIGGKNIYNENLHNYNQAILYMNTVYNVVKNEIAEYDNIGVWGTSIAGLCVFQMIRDILPDKNMFFVDEVPDEKEKYGIPIFKPSEVNINAGIFLPFPDYIAKNIKERMKKIKIMTSCKLINFYDYLTNEV